MGSIIQRIAQELDQKPEYVENVVRLLDEGNTIPFIARYRKELHGAMDDTSLRTLEERLSYLRGLQERREAVKSAIEAQGKLTEELARAMTKPPHWRRWRTCTGPISKSAAPGDGCPGEGLAPLAEVLFAQGPDCPDPLTGGGTVRRPGQGGRRRHKRLWPGRRTLWPSRSATTPPCVPVCGRCWKRTDD